MTEKKYKVGDVYECRALSPVVAPDGTEYVASGNFVLDRKGTFVIDGDEVDVK